MGLSYRRGRIIVSRKGSYSLSNLDRFPRLERKGGLPSSILCLLDWFECLFDLSVYCSAADTQGLILFGEYPVAFLGQACPAPLDACSIRTKTSLMDIEVDHELPASVGCLRSTRGLFEVPCAQQGSKNDHLGVKVCVVKACFDDVDPHSWDGFLLGTLLFVNPYTGQPELGLTSFITRSSLKDPVEIPGPHAGPLGPRRRTQQQCRVPQKGPFGAVSSSQIFTGHGIWTLDLDGSFSLRRGGV
jgi:hypothetical protein